MIERRSFYAKDQLVSATEATILNQNLELVRNATDEDAAGPAAKALRSASESPAPTGPHATAKTHARVVATRQK